MQIIETEIPDVKILLPKRYQDVRGYFCETYSRSLFGAAGIEIDFIQDNESLSAERGVVRGLHYQLPPAAQAKLIRVLQGAIRDVVVDIRRGSPTFGRHVRVDLKADGRQLLIPVGFAHGFATLEPQTVVLYKVSSSYSQALERGIRWNDPALQIDWGLGDAVILSERDQVHPLLSDQPDLF